MLPKGGACTAVIHLGGRKIYKVDDPLGKNHRYQSPQECDLRACCESVGESLSVVFSASNNASIIELTVYGTCC